MADKYDVEAIFKDLQNETEMDPDKHDGCYQLMHETVTAYSKLSNFTKLDYRDLDLIYLTTVLTKDHSIKLKKKLIENSHLSLEIQDCLKALWDDVWKKASNGTFDNRDSRVENGSSIGLFGKASSTFDRRGSKPSPEQVQDFIQMLIKLLPINDDEEMFKSAEKLFQKRIPGMRAGIASMILHCLKPYTFPILNNNDNNDNIFIVLNIQLDDFRELTTYIKNCRMIKDFRDNNFTFKNYRIFDQKARSLNQYKIVNNNQTPNNIESLQNPNISKTNSSETQEVQKQLYPLNMILYGPPGTGKTYHTAIYAVAIIEGLEIDKDAHLPIKSDGSIMKYEEVLDLYKKHKENGQIQFTTFHQSYGYEDFIEGIRPVLDCESDDNLNGNTDVLYRREDGVFKEFCQKASIPALKKAIGSEINEINEINANPKIWKVSLEGTGPNATRTECLNNDHIRIGWDEYGENPDLNNLPHIDGWKDGFGKTVLNAFINRMKIGDIVFSCYTAYTIDAIGVITGNADWSDLFDNYKRFRTVKWLAKDLNYDITEINDGKSMTLATVYALNSVTIEDVLKILPKKAPSEKSKEEKQPNYVIIIDEINRGNISKIFGELITLIEDTKRAGKKECVPVKLPYSHKEFSVPDNVYILGTMNTADRSIALLDTALRRRFSFIEMMPDADVLSNINISIGTESLSIKDMLTKMNQKIEVLYNREHTIGHAYFYPLVEEMTDEERMKKLSEIFHDKIIPLLQEYFYDDYEKIRLVLGDSKKATQPEHKFILTNNETTGDDKPDLLSLFGEVNSDYDFSDQVTYRINNDAFDKIESYTKI